MDSSADKTIQTRNVQADLLDNIRKLLFDARVLEYWLDKPDEKLIKCLDAAALAAYNAYHYIGTTRPDRVSLRKKLMEEAEDGKSESSK